MKLELETVVDVILARRRGSSYQQIADDFGISVKTVSNTATGKTVAAASCRYALGMWLASSGGKMPSRTALLDRTATEVRRRLAARYAA